MKTRTEQSLELIATQLDKLTTEIRLLRKTIAEHGIAVFPSLGNNKDDEVEKKDTVSDFDLVMQILDDADEEN